MLNTGDDIATMIAGRVLQGVSSALVWVVGLTLVADTVGSQWIGQYMGYIALSLSVGLLVSPFLGGIVFAQGGYNAVFGMVYVLLGMDVLLRVLLIERRHAKRWNVTETHNDQVEAQNSPDVADEELERDHGHDVRFDPIPRSPIIRLPQIVTLLASRRLLAALWGIFARACLLTSFDAVLPLFVQKTFGWNSTGAGT